MTLTETLGLVGSVVAVGAVVCLAVLLVRGYSRQEAAPRPDSEPQPDEPATTSGEYDVDRALDFYQAVAPHYDLRESGELSAAHLATVEQLRAVHRERPAMRVLDLGGGTGKSVAAHFSDERDIWWTYVDFCPAMAAELRRNLAGHPLRGHLQIVQADLRDTVREQPAHGFDVVLLSMVLSSMPRLPDFGEIARVLAPGGTVLVTDVSPCYPPREPLYRVTVNGESHTLRTTPVDPYEVIRLAKQAGLRVTLNLPLGDDTTYPSFVTAFGDGATATGSTPVAA